MQREWEPEELIGAWTLLDRDWRLVGNKAGPTRLGFALMHTQQWAIPQNDRLARAG